MVASEFGDVVVSNPAETDRQPEPYLRIWTHWIDASSKIEECFGRTLRASRTRMCVPFGPNHLTGRVVAQNGWEVVAPMALMQVPADKGGHTGFGPWLHRDSDFKSLWDCPPDQELLRPKR